MSFQGKNLDDAPVWAEVVATKGTIDVSWARISDGAFRKLIAHKTLCPDVKIVAVGYPAVVALGALHRMDMLCYVIDGSSPRRTTRRASTRSTWRVR